MNSFTGFIFICLALAIGYIAYLSGELYKQREMHARLFKENESLKSQLDWLRKRYS